MTYKFLDEIFPYIVFVYGILVTFVLTSEPVMRLARERLPSPLLQQLTGHRTLAFASLWIGGLWILQNLWVG